MSEQRMNDAQPTSLTTSLSMLETVAAPTPDYILGYYRDATRMIVSIRQIIDRCTVQSKSQVIDAIMGVLDSSDIGAIGAIGGAAPTDAGLDVQAGPIPDDAVRGPCCLPGCDRPATHIELRCETHCTTAQMQEASPGDFDNGMLCGPCSEKWDDWMRADPKLGKRDG